VRLYDAAVAGNWDEARALQQRINVLIRITLEFPLFPAVKQMLAWSGVDCGVCLPPRAPLTDDQQRALRTRLKENGFQELT
jgi:dihydrodipicolinate synthase/N-acetylneuraminate lyase